MSNFNHVLRLAALAAALGGATTALAQTADRGCIDLKAVAEIQETYTDARGNEATRLVPAAKVVPGDEVIWTIVANNVCTTPAGDIAITLKSITRWPVPHSSAHWPWNVWPASSSFTVNSKWLTCPGTTSRLMRNSGT